MNTPVLWILSSILSASALLVFVLRGWQKRKLKPGQPTLTVVAKPLLTPNETEFYGRLRRAAGDRWVVLAQVSMGALIDTSLRASHPQYWEHRSSFSSKICDFVLCDAASMKPRLIVELDDRMHDFDKDATRDNFAAVAGYRTIRFWSRKKPSAAELRDRLYAVLAPLDTVPPMR